LGTAVLRAPADAVATVARDVPDRADGGCTLRFRTTPGVDSEIGVTLACRTPITDHRSQVTHPRELAEMVAAVPGRSATLAVGLVSRDDFGLFPCRAFSVIMFAFQKFKP
jgi:hypothetical protein